jgi:hypothetical protein
MEMAFKGAKGKIKFLRVNDLGHVYGPPTDAIHTEVVVGLDSAPEMAFGMELRDGDPNLPARLAMLAVLRDAYVHKLDVAVAFDIVEGKQHGMLRRVELN